MGGSVNGAGGAARDAGGTVNGSACGAARGAGGTLNGAGGALYGDVVAVILAGGKNTRMISNLPKAMQKIGGKPMIGMVIDAVKSIGIKRCIVVVGFGAEYIMDYLADEVEYALQKEQLGTGHAFMTGLEYLNNTVANDNDSMNNSCYRGRVLALYGDMPFVSPETLAGLIDQNRRNDEHGTLTYAALPNPSTYGYGRIIRDKSGNFIKIVEQKDASEEEARIEESNIGVYCFDAEAAREALKRLRADNMQGEMYLTDVFAGFMEAGGRVGLYEVADIRECLGVNDRAALVELCRVMRIDKCTRLMLESGVTIVDPESTYIDQDVSVGMDTTILPGSVLEGRTVIGEACEIGPGARIRDSRVGDRVKIQYSVVNEAAISSDVSIGPYANLRPGAAIGAGTKIGDFVEIKNANIGEKVAISHLAYVGDADVGPKVNIGCGVITCNYDGKAKHRTTIGAHSFIGSNVNLIAPVTVNENAYVASGSTITEDVPEDALAIARGRQVNKEHWVSNKGFRRDNK